MKPFEDLVFCKIDYAREARSGCPEVIFGRGKTVQQIRAIFERLVSAHGKALVTLATDEMAEGVLADYPQAMYDPVARLIRFGEPVDRMPGLVTVLCAGTSDLPVAEEAAGTAEWLGCSVEKIYDVGVAGIDRLLAYRDKLQEANVLIVIAGMEGALPSVVGGMVRRPVIAVPTSVGYGAHLFGLTPLLSMLTSCTAGVSVVNIDNGFGAGYQAAAIQRLVLEAGHH